MTFELRIVVLTYFSFFLKKIVRYLRATWSINSSSTIESHYIERSIAFLILEFFTKYPTLRVLQHSDFATRRARPTITITITFISSATLVDKSNALMIRRCRVYLFLQDIKCKESILSWTEFARSVPSR